MFTFAVFFELDSFCLETVALSLEHFDLIRFILYILVETGDLEIEITRTFPFFSEFFLFCFERLSDHESLLESCIFFLQFVVGCRQRFFDHRSSTYGVEIGVFLCEIFIWWDADLVAALFERNNFLFFHRSVGRTRRFQEKQLPFGAFFWREEGILLFRQLPID
jgi:hypothetical protein